MVRIQPAPPSFCRKKGRASELTASGLMKAGITRGVQLHTRHQQDLRFSILRYRLVWEDAWTSSARKLWFDSRNHSDVEPKFLGTHVPRGRLTLAVLMWWVRLPSCPPRFFASVVQLVDHTSSMMGNDPAKVKTSEAAGSSPARCTKDFKGASTL